MRRLVPKVRIRRSTVPPLLKLTAFLTVSAVLTVYLHILVSDGQQRDAVRYSARFTNVSGLEPGDDVRVASVVVGRVRSVDLHPDATVTVHFDLDASIELTDQTTAVVHYQNLVGDRYLKLGPGAEEGVALEPGGQIPVDNTAAALNLDTLLNGFKPLFSGLNPQQVNELSAQLVLVFQGQTSAVGSLVSTVGSLTTTIGERDELIGQVVTNLHTTLEAIDPDHDGLGILIDELSGLVGGLETDAPSLLDSVERIDTLTVDLSELLAEVRPELPPALDDLRAVSETLNEHRDEVDRVLSSWPAHFDLILRAGSYGDFFNFYLCGVRLRITPESQREGEIFTPWINSGVERCQR